MVKINLFRRITQFLGLEDPELYTKHSFRRTSATMLADAGAHILTLKRHGGWKSSYAAEGYVQDSITNKRKICGIISDAVNLQNSDAVASSSTIMAYGIDDRASIEKATISCSQSIVEIIRSTTQLPATVAHNN